MPCSVFVCRRSTCDVQSARDGSCKELVRTDHSCVYDNYMTVLYYTASHHKFVQTYFNMQSSSPNPPGVAPATDVSPRRLLKVQIGITQTHLLLDIDRLRRIEELRSYEQERRSRESQRAVWDDVEPMPPFPADHSVSILEILRVAKEQGCQALEAAYRSKSGASTDDFSNSRLLTGLFQQPLLVSPAVVPSSTSEELRDSYARSLDSDTRYSTQMPDTTRYYSIYNCQVKILPFSPNARLFK